ncbi:MAG: PspC domain-containing protein [Chloroflexota bacterium]
MNKKQLTKSDADGKLAGVCSGLANYFDVDVTLVRLAFVVATLIGGPGLLVYIILALVLPGDPTASYSKVKNDYM